MVVDHHVHWYPRPAAEQFMRRPAYSEVTDLPAREAADLPDHPGPRGMVGTRRSSREPITSFARFCDSDAAQWADSS